MSSAAAAAASSGARSLLLLGATGRAGKAVLSLALERGWRVTAFVRDAARLPPGAAADPRVTVFVGNTKRAEDVAGAVAAARPAAVVDATSAVPFGHAPGAPRNDSDRAALVPALTAALRAEGVLPACALVVISGFIFPERDAGLPTLAARAINLILYAALGPALYNAAKKALDDLWDVPEPGFRFTVLRPAGLVEGPSRGRLRLESTAASDGKYPRGDITYVDLAAAIVDCIDAPHAFDRKGAYLNY